MKEKTTNTIRVERAIHRLTQGDLAVGANISRQSIHAIENNKFNPSVSVALVIVRFLNVLKEASGMKPITIGDVFKLEKLN